MVGTFISCQIIFQEKIEDTEKQYRNAVAAVCLYISGILNKETIEKTSFIDSLFIDEEEFRKLYKIITDFLGFEYQIEK